MITILFSVTVKSGKVIEFGEVAKRIADETRSLDKGCISYTWLQQQLEPRNFVLLEQWEDQDSLDAHMKHLRELVGSTSSSDGLPPELIAMFETSQAKMFDVVG